MCFPQGGRVVERLTPLNADMVVPGSIPVGDRERLYTVSRSPPLLWALYWFYRGGIIA